MAAQIKTYKETYLNCRLFSNSEFNSHRNNNLHLYFDEIEYNSDYIIKKNRLPRFRYLFKYHKKFSIQFKKRCGCIQFRETVLSS